MSRMDCVPMPGPLCFVERKRFPSRTGGFLQGLSTVMAMREVPVWRIWTLIAPLYLGWALATISMVLDPQAFLIGGGVSKAGTFLTDIIKRYHDELSPMATKKADIVLAKLGNDAGIYGAAKLIIG